MELFGLRCAECGWRLATSDGVSRSEASRAAITHYIETGHQPIVSCEVTETHGSDAR